MKFLFELNLILGEMNKEKMKIYRICVLLVFFYINFDCTKFVTEKPCSNHIWTLLLFYEKMFLPFCLYLWYKCAPWYFILITLFASRKHFMHYGKIFCKLWWQNCILYDQSFCIKHFLFLCCIVRVLKRVVIMIFH